MAQIRWTPQAADDLESITDYIGLDSPHYASFFAMNVISAAERLATHPRLGRAVPECSDTTIRELLLGNYRLIYRVREETVEILSVYHGSRIFDPQKLK